MSVAQSAKIAIVHWDTPVNLRGYMILEIDFYSFFIFFVPEHDSFFLFVLFLYVDGQAVEFNRANVRYSLWQ